MGKATYKGLVPKDDPMFSTGPELISRPASLSTVSSTMRPPPDLRTPEQKLKDKLEMDAIDRRFKEAFKNGVDLKGRKTP